MSKTIPETMIAAVPSEPGGPEVLQAKALPTPRAGPGEVLIAVEAAALNWADILERRGDYPGWAPKPTEVMGLEVAGKIAEVGADVSDWKIGDEVCALLAGGGYAEYCVAPAPQVLRVPKGMPMAQAAAIPEAFCTVWTNLFQRGHLSAGESVLIHGGASGIGTTAIILAHAFGAQVFATAGTDAKCRRCEELGAEKAINYKTEDFAEAVRNLTGGKGVDVILDMVGADYIQRDLDLLEMEGRLVSVGTLGSPEVALNLAAVLLKRLTITGSTLRSRSIEEKGALMKAVHDNTWSLLENGTITPVVDSTFPLDRAADAHRRMENREQTGKIILTMG